ncbi:NF-kappa-B inhibitor delta isoform X1 [Hypomesus transpacificus]|uniref:NF-kappa-B inhibitor delta isoform X1 n=1 Tax=Hypomesus transpacificus TaxID=137520 RepID=UPI001F07E29B|nr:NF-kappa-B inhibitor delta isoform X1 [Hypomesus transpacificus]
MHWQKSSKEKPCYSLPTVKKLLEQKRKRETASGSPSAATTSPAPPNVGQQVSTSELSTSTGACNRFSDMPVSYCESWEAVCAHPGPSAVLENPFASMGTSSYSNQTGLEDSSQASAYSLPMVSAYSPQPIQQSGPLYPDSLGHQFHLECPVSDAGPSLVSSSLWLSGAGAQGPTLSPYPRQLAVERQMDINMLREARAFFQERDYSWHPDEDGDTILHIYTAKGLREYAFAAAEKLRDLGTLDTKEHKGKTALLVAVTADQPEIVQDLLFLGADINACDVKGQTALHLAATYGYPRILQVILSSGPGVNLEARNFEGLTPLHCAAISHGATVKALSSAGLADASLNATADDKLSCLQMLLSAGAIITSQEIKSSKTVLHLAVKEGNIHLVRYLLRIRLSNMKDFVNMKAHGHTAIHMAAGLHGNPHQEEMLRLLLSKGADPSIRNLENDQPAHLLQSGPRGDQLKLILKKRSASTRRRVMSLQDQE